MTHRIARNERNRFPKPGEFPLEIRERLIEKIKSLVYSEDGTKYENIVIADKTNEFSEMLGVKHSGDIIRQVKYRNRKEYCEYIIHGKYNTINEYKIVNAILLCSGCSSIYLKEYNADYSGRLYSRCSFDTDDLYFAECFCQYLIYKNVSDSFEIYKGNHSCKKCYITTLQAELFDELWDTFRFSTKEEYDRYTDMFDVTDLFTEEFKRRHRNNIECYKYMDAKDLFDKMKYCTGKSYHSISDKRAFEEMTVAQDEYFLSDHMLREKYEDL